VVNPDFVVKTHAYYIYITTNPRRSVLYVGVTNNLKRRIGEHYADSLGPKSTFAGKYKCYNLVHYEFFPYIEDAIDRETQLKKYARAEKEKLIATRNPRWFFLNDKI